MKTSGKECESFCPLRRGRFQPQLSTKNTCPQILCEHHKTPFVLAGPLTSQHSISSHPLLYPWNLIPVALFCRDWWYAASTFQHVISIIRQSASAFGERWTGQLWIARSTTLSTGLNEDYPRGTGHKTASRQALTCKCFFLWFVLTSSFARWAGVATEDNNCQQV